jgi:hypothetical protein
MRKLKLIYNFSIKYLFKIFNLFAGIFNNNSFISNWFLGSFFNIDRKNL